MVAERRAPPVQPGSRVERLEKELAQVKHERDQLLSDERMAEWRDQRWRVNILGREYGKLKAQRDQLREALDECYALAIAWGAHYQFLHELDEMHGSHADAINKARAALKSPEDKCLNE